MLKLFLAFAIAWGLAVPAADARGPQKVDWSEYLESPSERAKPIRQKQVSDERQAKAKKKAKAKKVTKKRAAKKQKAKKRGKRRR